MQPVIESKVPETSANAEVPTQVHTPNQNNSVVESATEETQEQINWKKFREARDAERKQKEAAERRAAEKEAEAAALKAAMESILNKPSPIQQNQDPYYSDEPNDEKKIQKLIEEALAKERRKEEEFRRQKEVQELPQKLASAYSDFNSVCTTENLDYLEYHYPEVASAFKNAPDGFDKWASVYKAVKRFVPNTDNKKEQKKAESNFNKPQSMAVPGMTSTGDTAPMQLDDKKRQANWERMQRVMRTGK